MEATPVASQAGTQAGDLSVEHRVEELQKRLELLRVDAVLHEFEACRSRNERLIAWFRGRRTFLAQELGL